jgi:Flp pilus assembly protein TadG
MTRVRRDERGAASVEFALVVPLFFVLIGIAAYFAWQLFVEAQLDRAAQRAARFAAVPTSSGTYGFAHCDVVTVVNHQLTGLDVPDTGVAVRDAKGDLPPVTCPGGAAATRPSGYVRVRVTRVLDNPFADVLTFLLDRPGPMTITGSGEARVEDPT